MSGHSKWNNIQHRKGAQDRKRAKLFIDSYYFYIKKYLNNSSLIIIKFILRRLSLSLKILYNKNYKI